MLNYIEVINVCRICNNGFDKKGYQIENPNDYEIDLFTCPECKKYISKEIDKSVKRQYNKNKRLNK